MRFWLLFLLALLLTSCRATREVSTVERVVRDTVKVVRVARDTVATRDTVRERYWTRADTVWAVREVTRWRERVSRERDTLWRARTDTVRAVERVEVERKPSWWERVWPVVIGAASGFVGCGVLLFRRDKKC